MATFSLTVSTPQSLSKCNYWQSKLKPQTRFSPIFGLLKNLTIPSNINKISFLHQFSVILNPSISKKVSLHPNFLKMDSINLTSIKKTLKIPKIISKSINRLKLNQQRTRRKLLKKVINLLKAKNRRWKNLKSQQKTKIKFFNKLSPRQANRRRWKSPKSCPNWKTKTNLLQNTFLHRVNQNKKKIANLLRKNLLNKSCQELIGLKKQLSNKKLKVKKSKTKSHKKPSKSQNRIHLLPKKAHNLKRHKNKRKKIIRIKKKLKWRLFLSY